MKQNKKAFIDQIMLGFILFSTLIVIGTTISDNMQARDKYYNLKTITDNAVLTLGKYYVRVLRDTDEAESIYYDMLNNTKLGNEIKDTISYAWDLNSYPRTVIATISTYQESTFWFKFLGLDSFDLKVESKANIIDEELPTPTSTYTNGLAPFAVNEQNFVIGDSFVIDYDITALWLYENKTKFYPIITNCDCDCSFILNNQFDFSSLGFDVDSCNSSSTGCTTHGESEFSHYTNDLADIYNSKQIIDFENGKTNTPICLLGTYLGNTLSTWGTQITHLTSGLFDIIGTSGSNLPLEMDILTLNENAISNGIVRVRIDSYDIRSNGNPDNRYITLNTTIVPAKERIVQLVY